LSKLDETALQKIALVTGGRYVRSVTGDVDLEAVYQQGIKASLEDLVPVPAGRFVVHGSHDRDRVAPNKLAIEIEAALAFGTGHHGTTRGCLLALDRLVKQQSSRRQANLRVLDVGTGTGVLAIALAKLGVKRVVALDVDPQAITAARGNVRRNALGGRVRLACESEDGQQHELFEFAQVKGRAG